MIRALLSLLLLTGPAWATSISIGELQFLSTNSQGVSSYKVSFMTGGVTAQPLTFANVTLSVGAGHENTGPISTVTNGIPGADLACNGFGGSKLASSRRPLDCRAMTPLAV